jgi:hypothetical protein
MRDRIPQRLITEARSGSPSPESPADSRHREI